MLYFIWRMIYKMKKLLIFSIIIGVVSFVYAGEAKKLQLTGNLPSIVEMLPDMGAVTFVGDGGLSGLPYLEFYGSSSEPDSAIIDGYNHDLSGNQIGESDLNNKPGVVTNVDELIHITQNNTVDIKGTPQVIEDNVNLLSISGLTNYFINKADIVVLENTEWSTQDSVGSSGALNYKIVYVDDVNIVLKDSFSGYGVLVIRDASAAGSSSRLTMMGRALWEGLVIIYQDSVGTTTVTMEGSASLIEYPIDAIGSFMALALSEMDILQKSEVLQGNIGVNDSGGILNLGKQSIIGSEDTRVNIGADRVVIDDGLEMWGDIYYNSQLDPGSGALFHPPHQEIHQSLPFVDSADLPVMPAFFPGSGDEPLIKNNTTLLPGTYGNITVKNNKIVTLLTGDYDVNRWILLNGAKIEFSQANCEIRVREHLTLSNNCEIIPANPSVDASDLKIFVDGVGNTRGVFFDANVEVHASIYAPDGRIDFSHGGDYYGGYVADSIIIAQHTDFHQLDSAWGPMLGDQAKPRILGAMLIEGQEFRLPNGFGNNEILYSQEAVDNVESLIEESGFAWGGWKRLESDE